MVRYISLYLVIYMCFSGAVNVIYAPAMNYEIINTVIYVYMRTYV
ncbi:hypothetical protein ALTERO38_60005 [Alteromonas sp. 38]|nr:hypothetical protein ALTER154_40785 [Alteromonas sp. 154]VXC04696.1 hypothetical protein ALTERO38_60005 [Alteromonas sp. 38]